MGAVSFCRVNATSYQDGFLIFFHLMVGDMKEGNVNPS